MFAMNCGAFNMTYSCLQCEWSLPATRGHGYVPINGAMGWVPSWWGRGSAGHRVISVVWRGELLWQMRTATKQQRMSKHERAETKSWNQLSELMNLLWQCASAWTMMQCYYSKSHKKSYVQLRGRNSPAVFLDWILNYCSTKQSIGTEHM